MQKHANRQLPDPDDDPYGMILNEDVLSDEEISRLMEEPKEEKTEQN